MLRPLLLGISAAAFATGCVAVPEARLGADVPRTMEAAGCLQATGTRIRRDEHECLSVVPGRSYSKADLDRTGAFTTAEALQMLDPAITVGR